MKKLLLKLLALLSSRRDKNPVIQDLLDNDHHTVKSVAIYSIQQTLNRSTAVRPVGFILTTLSEVKNEAIL